MLWWPPRTGFSSNFWPWIPTRCGCVMSKSASAYHRHHTLFITFPSFPMAVLTSAVSGSAPTVMMELKSAPSMPIGHSNFLIPFTGFDTWNPPTGSGPPDSFTIHWTLASATEAAFVDLMWSLIDSSCFIHSPSLLDAMELPPSTRATVKPHHCVRNSAEPIPSRASRALYKVLDKAGEHFARHHQQLACC